jgi:hypothetical protein
MQGEKPKPLRNKKKSLKKSLSRSRIEQRSTVNNTFIETLSNDLLPKKKFTSLRGGARNLRLQNNSKTSNYKTESKGSKLKQSSIQNKNLHKRSIASSSVSPNLSGNR